MTKIQTIPASIDVECPKETGKMDRSVSCRECRYYDKCTGVIKRALFG